MSLIQLRSSRIFGVAVFDLVLAIVLTEVLFRYNGADNWVGATLAVPIGIAVHAVLGISTSLNHRLGISEKPI